MSKELPRALFGDAKDLRLAGVEVKVASLLDDQENCIGVAE